MPGAERLHRRVSLILQDVKDPFVEFDPGDSYEALRISCRKFDDSAARARRRR